MSIINTKITTSHVAKLKTLNETLNYTSLKKLGECLNTVYKSATINDSVETKFQKTKPNEFSEALICTFVYLALLRDY